MSVERKTPNNSPSRAGELNLTGGVADALCRAIDERREEIVELTRELVRFPTVNPPGEAYRPCAEFIGRRLARRPATTHDTRAST